MQLRIPYMRTRYLVELLYLTLLLPVNTQAQDSHYGSGNYFDKIKQITESGATPVKAGLKTNIESPVNVLTGAVSFDIPIYTVENGNYTLPITLHYETSGFKVVDIASNVGMGWSISAGGCITRTVKGKPDELYKVGYSSQGHVSDSIHGLLQTLKDREDLDTLNENHTLEDSIVFAMLLEITDNHYDPEPDIYSFSFAGYSGSFVYDTDGDIHLIPKQNYLIQKNTSGFVITVDNGDKFFFESGNAVETIDYMYNTPLFEKTSIFESAQYQDYFPNRYLFLYDPGEQMNTPITWYLTKIVLADSGKQIEFEYDSDDVRTYIGTDETYMMGQRYISRTQLEFESGHDWIVHRINRYKFAHVPRLRSITWNNGKIDFLPSFDYREDLNYLNFNSPVSFGGRSINKIAVSSMSGDQNEKDSLTIILNQSYFKDFHTTVPHPNGIPNDYRSYYKRLRLDTVEFLDSDNNILNSYVFTYNSKNAAKCPSRNSCELDCWGYYKPREENEIERQIIKPQLYYYEDGKDNPLYNSVYSVWPRSGNADPSCVLGGNDMTSDAIGSQEFTLKSILLPTGGQVNFEYERNDFYFDNQEIKGPGVRVKTVKYNYNDYQQPNERNSLTKTYSYRDGNHSSGRISSIPDLGQYQFLPELLYGAPTGGQCDAMDYHTARRFSTVTDMKGVSESLVHYTKITESVTNHDVNMGKTVYYHQLNFTAADSVLSVNNEVFVRKTECRKSHVHQMPQNVGFGTTIYTGRHLDASPNFTYPIVSWYSGFLTKKEHYDKNDCLLESTEYKYRLKPANDSVFYIQSKFLEKFVTAWVIFDHNSGEQYNIPAYQYDILWGVNYYKTGTRVLDSVINKRYDQDNGNLANTLVRTYVYNEHNYLNVEQTVTSGGDSIRQHYSYPCDYGSLQPSTLYQSMLNKNMQNSVIEQYASINGMVTEGIYYQYIIQGNGNRFIKPGRIFTLRTDTPLLSFQPSISSSGYDSHYELEKEIQYDPVSGNILEINDENAGTTTYVWGYNDSRIIAKIQNSSAIQVQNALTCPLAVLNGKTDTEELIGIFNTLRTALPQAMITSYTYDLFLNTLSVTDPSGRTLRYEYDAAQRLKLTRNADNSIVQQFEYHYKRRNNRR